MSPLQEEKTIKYSWLNLVQTVTALNRTASLSCLNQKGQAKKMKEKNKDFSRKATPLWKVRDCNIIAAKINDR